jgi:hypothetical protein
MCVQPSKGARLALNTRLKNSVYVCVLDGALLIQQAGIQLRAPQVVMTTAAVLFQRFYYVSSFRNFGIKVCAPSPLAFLILLYRALKYFLVSLSFPEVGHRSSRSLPIE